VTFTDTRSVRAGSFGTAAAIYERARPSYPADALDWLLPAGSPRVLDLGAGTGKLTRLIAERGINVEAVDPSAQMLAELEQVLPDVRTHVGTAEQMPLPDSSFDAIVVAQAWHWVDLPRAAAETARVLKPGGRLGLIWNDRDDRVDWIRALSDVVGDTASASRMASDNPIFGAPFGQIEYFVTEWSNPITPAGLIELVASRSFVIVASERDRTSILGGVQDLLETHPDLAGREEFEMPYVTYASRAHVA
jgi:SAM-dependent methyltransferase